MAFWIKCIVYSKDSALPTLFQSAEVFLPYLQPAKDRSPKYILPPIVPPIHYLWGSSGRQSGNRNRHRGLNASSALSLHIVSTVTTNQNRQFRILEKPPPKAYWDIPDIPFSRLRLETFLRRENHIPENLRGSIQTAMRHRVLAPDP